MDSGVGALSLSPFPAEKIPPTFPNGFWIGFLTLVCLGLLMEALGSDPVGCHLSGEDTVLGSPLAPGSSPGPGSETPLPLSPPSSGFSPGQCVRLDRGSAASILSGLGCHL